MSTKKTVPEQETASAKLAAWEAISKINAVEGFDPAPLAVQYNDLNSGESRKKLPVMVWQSASDQMAWFRLKYPEGRVAVSVVPGKDCFVATARVYHHFSDQPEQFLAEATASRGYLQDKPSVSPREWAQTAAVGIALRNAGFGLQFGAAGDIYDGPAVNELDEISWGDADSPMPPTVETPAPTAPTPTPEPAETPLERALKLPCPITKHKGKTLGDVLREDPKAIVWVANKFKGDEKISAGARLICEQAMQESA